MVKQLKDLIGLNTLFAYDEKKPASVFSLPNNKQPFIGENLSPENFINFDYAVSNPRLLMADAERKVTGSPFSQSVYASHLFGIACFQKLPDTKLLSEGFQATYVRELAKSTLKVLHRSELDGCSGGRSALVSCKEVVNGEYVFLPFLISPTIFFNFFRATIGIGNSEADAKLVLKDIASRMGSEQVELFSAKTVNEIEDWVDFVNDYAQEKTMELNKSKAGGALSKWPDPFDSDASLSGVFSHDDGAVTGNNSQVPSQNQNSSAFD